MTRNEQIIYLAGLIDGEGCIGLYNTRTKTDSRSPRYQLLVRVTMTTPQSIKRLQEIFPGNVRVSANNLPNCKTAVFEWRVTDKKARATLEELLPYLLDKKPQAQLALEFYDFRMLQNKQRMSRRASAKYTKTELAERELYVHQLKALKHVEYPLNVNLIN